MYTDSIKKANELPLDEMLMSEMKKNYLEAKDKFEEQLTNPEEMKEFYHQVCQIIDDFKKKR